MGFNIGDFISHVKEVCKTSCDYKFTMSEIEIILEIVEKNHRGDGYFSMDGVYDEMVDLLGKNEASRNLYNQIMCP